MTVSTKNRALRLAIGVGVGSAVTLLSTYCAFRLHSNLPTAGFIDLLIVVLTALQFGFWEATGCSLFAVAYLDYFFAPPIYSFHVAAAENWVALVTFEIIALVVSRLSNRLQTETYESLLHRRNAERLYELSRSILALDRERTAGAQISSLIKKHVGADSVVIFDGSRAQLHTAGACAKEDEELARGIYLRNESHDTLGTSKWQRAHYG